MEHGEELRGAAILGDLEEMVRLLNLGADINGADEDGVTALMWASRRGHLDCVKELLEMGALVNAQDTYGRTALMEASQKGHMDCVKELLEKGALVNAQATNGWTAMIWASHEGHSDCVKELLEKGALVNAQDKDGVTALMWASRRGHSDCVKELLEKGALVNAQDKNGWTALMRASCWGYLDCVKELLEKGALVNAQHTDGWTALMRASSEGHLDCVKELLEKGALVNAQDTDGKTALMGASIEGHLDCVKELLEMGALVNAQDKDGRTALMWASVGHLDCVKELLEKGALVNAQATCGETALMVASSEGHLDCVKELLEKGALVNAQNTDGNTALHIAAEYRHEGSVRLLLSAPGIDANLVNHSGETPLKLATSYEVLTLLQKYTTSCEDFPVHTYGKVIMCGDSGAGKSTLTEVILHHCESTSEGGMDQHLARRTARKPVKALTAGIVPHQVKSPRANMTVYDLAGHREYYSSHSSILELISKTTPSVFLLLVNLLLSLENIIAQIYYWSSLIGNVCHNCPQQSSIIVVGTHADCVGNSKKIEHLCIQIQQAAKNAIKHQIFVQFTALNVTSFSNELDTFLSSLHHIIDDVRIGCPAISLSCHVMYAFLNDKVPAHQDAISMSQLLILLNQENPKVLPTDAAGVSELLKTLSEKGFIVFFDTNLADSWIVLRQDTLLEKVSGVLFAPAHFEEHIPIASNTGVIPISVLKCHFPKYNIDMITQFLIRFELCQPITLAPNNTALQVPPICSCPDLFIPALISASKPDDVTIPNDAFGWKMCTVSINQSFSPRFLHVLVSRIADEFPLQSLDTCLNPDLLRYNRCCTVWRRGISWWSAEGYITIIEMSEDFRCLLLAVSTDDKTDITYSKFVLSVIKVIADTCNEFCPSVSRVELIICPPEATSDHVAATVECEVLKTILLKGTAKMIDSTRKKYVIVSRWREVEPQLPTLLGVQLKQDPITASLTADDHTKIYQTTISASDRWRAIGGVLGFTFDELDSIVREPGRHGDEDYYAAVLRRWLDWAPPNHTPPSLQSLLSALRAAGKEIQANNLEAKYKK